MTGGLDGSSQETQRLMSERKTQETRPRETPGPGSGLVRQLGTVTESKGTCFDSSL